MKVVTSGWPFEARLCLLKGSSGWYVDCKCSKSSNNMLDVCQHFPSYIEKLSYEFSSSTSGKPRI